MLGDFLARGQPWIADWAGLTALLADVLVLPSILLSPRPIALERSNVPPATPRVCAPFRLPYGPSASALCVVAPVPDNALVGFLRNDDVYAALMQEGCPAPRPRIQAVPPLADNHHSVPFAIMLPSSWRDRISRPPWPRILPLSAAR